jgi:hypothetical protein
VEDIDLADAGETALRIFSSPVPAAMNDQWNNKTSIISSLQNQDGVRLYIAMGLCQWQQPGESGL